MADQVLDIDLLKGIAKTIDRGSTRGAVSERRASVVVGQPWFTQRVAPPAPNADELRAFLLTFSAKRPRWGWRRAHVGAREADYVVNQKKDHRLGREDSGKVPYQKRQQPRRAIGVRLREVPIAPGVIWAMNRQFDQTSDGRQLKLLILVDESSRERLVIEVERSIDADQVVRVLERRAVRRAATGVSTVARTHRPSSPTGAA